MLRPLRRDASAEDDVMVWGCAGAVRFSCVVMKGLTEIDDILGGRNKGNRSQRSSSVRCEHLGGLG